MGELYTYNATHLTTVRENTTELRLSAELGRVGGGTLTVEDVAGTLAIVGQKDFAHTESSCASNLTFRGYIADRAYNREAFPQVGASRDIRVELVDTNAMLGFRLIYQKTGLSVAQGGYRPSETVAARAAWLMASDFVSGLFVDNGRCDFSSTVTMDKADYRYQYPGDVLADMAMAQGGGVNYHVNDYGAGPELTFRNDNTSTADPCALRLSNVLADASAVTLNPFKDAVLTRSPSDVYSKIAYSYSQGTLVEEEPATATAFNGERGGSASNSNVKSATMASTQALSMLAQHATEKDLIECTVLATSAQVNLIPPGWRIEAKFSHLATEGYGSFTWFRILEVTRKPIVADGGLYEVRLRLSPQEVPPTPDICSDLYPPTPSDTYYALGGTNGGPTNGPNPSDGVIYYWRGGLGVPFAPDPTYVGSWHYGVWGAGGVGSIDYAGDCVGNALILISVGNGTWTIQTEMYGGVLHRLWFGRGPEFGSNDGLDLAANSGEAVEVTISDTTDGDCIRVVWMYDPGPPYGPCGSKWGFRQAVWVAA